jgi:hypothetical protein
MSELTILFGGIVLILIIMMYNKQNSSCGEYITYFDQMYYDPTYPVDDVASDKSVQENLASNLNEISNTSGLRSIMLNESNTNIVGNKWIPLMDHPSIDDTGRVQYDCLDKQTIPQTFIGQIRSKGNNNPLPSSVTQRGAVINEGFADDAWMDPSFKFNNKYNSTDRDLNDYNMSANFHETKSNYIRPLPASSQLSNKINWRNTRS